MTYDVKLCHESHRNNIGHSLPTEEKWIVAVKCFHSVYVAYIKMYQECFVLRRVNCGIFQHAI